jgi:hypothetical protein
MHETLRKCVLAAEEGRLAVYRLLECNWYQRIGVARDVEKILASKHRLLRERQADMHLHISLATHQAIGQQQQLRRSLPAWRYRGPSGRATVWGRDTAKTPSPELRSSERSGQSLKATQQSLCWRGAPTVAPWRQLPLTAQPRYGGQTQVSPCTS